MEKEATLIANIIKEVHESGKLVPDLMKCENGNNFRAISEKAILDVLNPILDRHGIYYTVRVEDQHLEIKEAYGAKGKKLQFIATVKITLCFTRGDFELGFCTQSVGMGIDDNDKAMGKAYTYAIKYALLKLFRLCYGDDSDFEASKPLLTEPKAHAKAESVKAEKADEKKSHRKPSKGGSSEASLAQLDYIAGLMKKKKITDLDLKQEFGYNTLDKLTMEQARELIKYLQDYEVSEEDITDDDLPF